MERVAFLIESSGARIDCLLNPETVVFRRQAGLKRRTVIGHVLGGSAWSDDTLVCGGGGITEVQLDLLFDASLTPSPNAVEDVRKLTAPFWELAEHAADSQGHYRPRLARLIWGKVWNLLGVVTAVAERFEHFSVNGAPQRSWLRLNFVRVAESATAKAPIEGAIDLGSVAPVIGLPEPTPNSGIAGNRNDDNRSALGTQGRLDQVAFELTGDPSNWRWLADYSGIDDPTSLKSGSMLRVPPRPPSGSGA